MQTRQTFLILFIIFCITDRILGQETVEQRLGILEKRISQLESRIDSLTRPTTGMEVSRKTVVSKNPIQLTLVEKSFSPANITSGRYQDLISFEFDFVNNLSKQVRAFTGTVVFQDLFERDILRIRLTVEETVAPGKKGNWSGGIDYNQFIDEHKRLRSIAQKDITLKFELASVIYSDGTREKFGQE